MKGKRFLRRLRALLRRRKAKGANNQPEPVIVHHSQEPQDDRTTQINPITAQEMRATADPQDLAPFFQKLPVEIRLKIYHQVWRNYLKPRRVGPLSAGSDLRLHIYTPSPASRKLVHTRCTLHPGEPGPKDVSVARDIQREDWPSTPLWYRDAWVLRLNWGKHWRCQHAVQKQWDVTMRRSAAGSSAAPKAPFLPLFLACKRMYLEAAQSLFETVTLVFTSSADAHQFFAARPRHPFLPHLRSLELSIAYTNDHLFLSKILHDNPPRPSTGGSDLGPENAAAPSEPNDSPTTAGAAAPVASPEGQDPITDSKSKVCFSLVCRLDLFGDELWPFLMKEIRTAAPHLKDLDVEIGGRIERSVILDSFGVVEDDEPSGDPSSGGTRRDGEEARGTSEMADKTAAVLEAVECGNVWTLPGKLVVVFSGGTAKQGYIQAGKRMESLEMPQE